jgi:hypothetical protein
MSPSEFELRRALQPGEGEPGDALNVDALIGKAQGIRHERRMRMVSVAAAVVVVGAVGIGGATVYSNSGSTKKTSASDAMQSQKSASAPREPNANAATSFGSATGGGGAAAGVSACAAAGGTTVSASSVPPAPNGALQAGAVDSVIVCVTPAASTTGSGAVDTTNSTYTGSQAQQIADSLNAASATRIGTVCPMGGSRNSGQLDLIFQHDGAVTAAVRVTQSPSCSLDATNGTTTRYNWQPPSFLAETVGKIETGGPLSK